jgi:hypothetical protein
MELTRFVRFRGVAALLLAIATTLAPVDLSAQATSLGTISGRIVDDRGAIVPDATLTLTRGGVQVRIAQASVNGEFRLAGLVPGQYALLAEQVGYQPVRTIGIEVVGGTTAWVEVRLERRPPPITTVTEVRHQAASRTVGSGVSRSSELGTLARSNDATSVAQSFSHGFLTGDGRGGLGFGANGLAPAQTRLVVDGIEEMLLRHPGLPGESGTAPIFTRQSIAQATLDLNSFDPEVPAGPGAVLSLLSSEHRGPVQVRPWVSYSGTALGASSADNPADSSASSIQVGATIGGGFRADSGSWGVSIEYRNISEPTAARFEPGAEVISQIQEAAGNTDVSRWTAPTVRNWSGVIASGNLSWQFAPNARIGARLGVASWNEDNPLLAAVPSNGAGTSLEANDVSGSASFDLAGEDWFSETRVGIQSSSREWKGASLLPTTLAGEAISIGGASVLPGSFKERRLTATETVTMPLDAFVITVGGGLTRRNFTHDWLLDGTGSATFGSLDDLADGFGYWTGSTTSGGSAVDFSITELAGFGLVEWRPSSSLTLSAAARYEAQSLPMDLVTPNAEVARVMGIANFFVPGSKKSAIGPRLGISYDVGGRGTTIARVNGGLVPGRYDIATLAEVARNDGGVTRRRFLGEFAWPGAPASGTLESTPISLLSTDVRAPRSFVIDAGISQAVAPGTVLELSGGYSHTDYLLRRADLNRPVAPLATGDGGRAIWGELEQHGSMIVATPGSNRRFEDFDNVWFLSSSGYSDHKHATIQLRHESAGGLSVSGSYTWSSTEDNLPGQLSADPADRAIVVGTGVDAPRWDIGTSDLDIPHRVVLQAGYQVNAGFSIAARWRWRSGLPFTPGFAAGVDANGDGSWSNDPVSLQAVAGVRNLLESYGCKPGSGALVERNSCREPAVQALDLEAGIRLPFGGARSVMLTIAAFNLTSSDQGLVDRAAVKVDPDDSITTDANGRKVLPLVINENFGEILVRRNDPRTVRLGLRVEY